MFYCEKYLVVHILASTWTILCQCVERTHCVTWSILCQCVHHTHTVTWTILCQCVHHTHTVTCPCSTWGLVYQSQGGLKIFCSVYTSTPFPLTSAPPSAPPFLSCLYIHCMADIHLHTYIPFPFPAIYTHMYKWEDIKRQEVCSLWFS